MTPEDEIEYIIKEIAVNADMLSCYIIKSFPEIYINKFVSHYSLRILKDYRENYAIIRRSENVINSVISRKITIENKVIDRDRGIVIRGNDSSKYIQTYYKNCIFTDNSVVYGKHFENCIIEKG